MKAEGPKTGAAGATIATENSAASELTDGQLLERFISSRDEAAFEALIHRHGKLVWGVCRRALKSHHDAEDAFQAAFLILAKRAPSIIPREMLPNWLYGVACQVALKARSVAVRRHAKEKQVGVMPEPGVMPQGFPDERLWLLDRELSHLPDKYRAPIILCEFEELTHQQAADRLGCAVGTLSARLSRGRSLLAKRLSQRGVAVSMVGLGVLLAREAHAAVAPISLTLPTAKAAALIAGGQGSAPGFVSLKAVMLANGAANAMMYTKVKVISTVLASLTVLTTATVLSASRPDSVGERTRNRSAQITQIQDERQIGALDPSTERAANTQPAGGKTVPRSSEPALVAEAVPGVADEQPVKAAERDGAPIWNIALSPDGKRLAAGVEGLGGKPAELIIWELETRRELLRITEPRISRSVAFSPDGLSVVTGGFGRIARIFNAANGRIRRPLRGHTAGINAVAYSPDGRTVATGSWDKTVKLWDAVTGQARATLEGHTAQVFGLAYGPDGKTVASCGCDGTARVWDASSGTEKAVLKGHDGVVEFLTYSPDGKTLATAGWDSTVRLWDVAKGRELAKLEGPSDQLGVAFSPDGKTLASLSAPANGEPEGLTSVITIWDVDTHALLTTIPAHSDRAYSVLFSPDGKTLISSSKDRTIKVWDLATRKNTATLNSLMTSKTVRQDPEAGKLPSKQGKG